MRIGLASHELRPRRSGNAIEVRLAMDDETQLDDEFGATRRRFPHGHIRNPANTASPANHTLPRGTC